MGEKLGIWLVFVMAAGYLGWRIYNAFRPGKSTGCSKGCGCESSDAVRH